MSKDLISAIMEAITVILVFVDIFALRKDKELKGSRIYPKFYWLGYGGWGTYLLYLLNLKISCAVAGFSEIVYAVYIAMCIWFKYKK
jgi:hypothetical protein